MKILGIKTAYRLTKQKILTSCCVVAVTGLCCAAAVAVNTLLNFSDVQALRVDSGDMVDVYDVIPVEYAPDRDTYNIRTPLVTTSENAGKMGPAETTVPPETEPEETTTETTEEIIEETTVDPETTETAETEEPTEPEETETDPGTETTPSTTKAAKKVTQTNFKKTVYARTTVNIRKGPGTAYKAVRKATVNQAISVVAKTSNGWYKTSDGYYVKQSLTTLSSPKPTATKAPTRKPTKKPTKKPTNKPTPKVATKTTVKKVNGVKCKITFYGPVLYKRKDGSTFYSTTTATGTKCKQGRTCAADWKVFPKNSWIYIEKDPLGGDGLYKVEDTGRFTGNWIDIYVDSAKGHNTCYRNVYKQ